MSCYSSNRHAEASALQGPDGGAPVGAAPSSGQLHTAAALQAPVRSSLWLRSRAACVKGSA